MKCPHCLVAIHENFRKIEVASERSIGGRSLHGDAPRVLWSTLHQTCPECLQSIILVEGGDTREFFRTYAAYPRASSRPVPTEVPDPYRQDFTEACAVLSESPKASAALSRRCVQAILRDKAGTTKKDLHDQIEEVILSGKVPSHIADNLHAVRNIGNFAAHPAKSTSSGEIIDVEPGEAEWNLDVLEFLFDFYFVQPALSKRRRAELNKKLKEAGKPQLP